MLAFFAGIVAGLISAMGMGGGTILILILSVFLGLSQHTAQATNLIFFIPTSAVVIFLNIKNKKINWKIAIPITIFGIIGAIIGAKLSLILDENNLKKYFGYFLLLIALYEITSFIKENIFSKKSNNNKKEKNK